MGFRRSNLWGFVGFFRQSSAPKKAEKNTPHILFFVLPTDQLENMNI